MDNFITTNECYNSATILNKSDITLENGTTFKYSEFISDVSSPFFDISNMNFEMETKNSIEIYNECKDFAESNNSNIFLISDVSSKMIYIIIIVMFQNKDIILSTLDELINPFREVLKHMFNITKDRLNETNDISNILKSNITPVSDSSNITQDQGKNINFGNYNKSCYRINDISLILPKTNSFGVFYTDFFDFNQEIQIKNDDFFKKTNIQYIQDISSDFTERELNIKIDNLKRGLYDSFCQTTNNYVDHKAIDKN